MCLRLVHVSVHAAAPQLTLRRRRMQCLIEDLGHESLSLASKEAEARIRAGDASFMIISLVIRGR